MSYSNQPVSVHNSFPSAPRAWARICFYIASYGGELDLPFYNSLVSSVVAQRAVAKLQQQGIQFTSRKCFHWAVELCGAFEVTHPQYKAPAGSELPAANALYATVSAYM